jgi:hypothetical protein
MRAVTASRPSSSHSSTDEARNAEETAFGRKAENRDDRVKMLLYTSEGRVRS